MKKLSVFLLLIICLSSCATSKYKSDMPESFKISELSLYMSRASMHSRDFEHYKVTNKRLFQECGVIRRGRHVPTHQELFDLKDSVYTEAMGRVWTLLELSAKGEAQFEEPGNTDTIFDPGRVLITIKGNNNSLKITTSVDSIVDTTTKASTEANELVRLIRGAAKPAACGNASFYGVNYK